MGWWWEQNISLHLNLKLNFKLHRILKGVFVKIKLNSNKLKWATI